MGKSCTNSRRAGMRPSARAPWQSSWPRRERRRHMASSSSARAALARRAAARGHRPGGPHRVVDGEQPLVSRGVVGGPALRAPLHARSTGTCVPIEVQYVLDDCGAVHTGHVANDARRVGDARPLADRHEGLSAMATCRDSSVTTTSCRPRRPTWLGRRAGGPGDALLVRHDWATQGRAQAAAATRHSAIRRRRRCRSPRESACTAAGPAPCTSRPRRSTTPRRSSTACRCSASARRSS